jgi:tetratricopeptide (TPR) repeat protein
MNAQRPIPRRLGALLVAGLLAVPAGEVVHAEYPLAVLKDVPVARLVENLERAVQKNPKDARLHYNLARVHAMAYALKTDKAKAQAGDDTAGAWFGYEPKFVPFTPRATDDAARRRAAAEQLQKAIAEYQKAVELAPDYLAARLGLAWTVEQSGDKKKAVGTYRDVIERGWKKEKDRKTGALGGHYITAEAADYLIPLLDATRDREEIATLRDRAQHLRKLPRPVTPVAIPLRDGLRAADLVDRTAGVTFDADGTGPGRWTWVTPEAGWLVHDLRGKGEVTSGLQLFGSVTFWCFWETGYDALAALDDDGDGVLRGDELKHLAVWHDKNGNGVAEPGEVRSLAELGIVALSCRGRRLPGNPDCAAWSPAGVVFRDGRTRPTYDLILRRR